jgi:hypothetical protein
MYAFLNPRLACLPREERTDIARLQLMAVQSTKDNLGLGQTKPLAFIKPARHQAEGSGIHADGSMTISFAVAHRQRARGSIEVAPFQRQGLREAQTSAVEDCQQRPVANTGGCTW